MRRTAGREHRALLGRQGGWHHVGVSGWGFGTDQLKCTFLCAASELKRNNGEFKVRQNLNPRDRAPPTPARSPPAPTLEGMPRWRLVSMPDGG